MLYSAIVDPFLLGVFRVDHPITRSFPLVSLLQLVNHAIQVRIAGAKASGEPVPAALHHFLAIGQDVKLAGLSRRYYGINAQPIFNHGRETRSLGFVALSRRAGTYLDFHSGPPGFPDQCYPC